MDIKNNSCTKNILSQKKGKNKMKTMCLSKDSFPENCFNMDEYTKNLKKTKIAKIKRWISVRLAETGIF